MLQNFLDESQKASRKTSPPSLTKLLEEKCSMAQKNLMVQDIHIFSLLKIVKQDEVDR